MAIVGVIPDGAVVLDVRPNRKIRGIEWIEGYNVSGVESVVPGVDG